MSAPVNVKELEQKVRSLQCQIDQAQQINTVIELQKIIHGLDPHDPKQLQEAIGQIGRSARKLDAAGPGSRPRVSPGKHKSQSALRTRPWRVINACLRDNAGKWMSPAQINDDQAVTKYCRKADIGLSHIQKELREKTESGKVEFNGGKYRYSA